MLEPLPFGSTYLYSFISGLDSRNHNPLLFFSSWAADVESRTLGLVNANCSTPGLYVLQDPFFFFFFLKTGAHYVALLGLKFSEFCPLSSTVCHLLSP